jgi:hypothetical protein
MTVAVSAVESKGFHNERVKSARCLATPNPFEEQRMISAKPLVPQNTMSFCHTLILPLALLTFMAAALFCHPRQMFNQKPPRMLGIVMA